jgi:heat shock protein HslJ
MSGKRNNSDKHRKNGMRYSGVVIILVIMGLVLASGCTGLFPKKTSDSTTTGKPGSQALSPGANAASSLVKPWYVKALIFNKTPKVPVRLTGIQINFYTNGSFDGFDSCNPYTGLWKADEKRITISRIESPANYCNEPPGVMEQESEYFALLTNASYYLVNGEDMVMSDETRNDGLVFKQVFF